MSALNAYWLDIRDRPIPKASGSRYPTSPLSSVILGSVRGADDPRIGRETDAALTAYVVEQLSKPAKVPYSDGPNARLQTDLYVAMSALQKAIRLNDGETAARVVIGMINSGQKVAAWRRLRVIAVEDIGIADPAVAILVMWLAGNCGLRSVLGEAELGVLAVDHLCRAAKSRDMTDVHYWLNLPGTIDEEIRLNMVASTPDLLDLAANDNATLSTRAAALRAFYPHRFRKGWEWRKRRLEDRMALYRRLGTDSLVVAMIEKDLEFGTDVLTCMGPIVDLMVRASPTTEVTRDTLDEGDEPRLVHGVYGSAYDRHTWLGRRAIAEMLHMSEDFRAFFRRHRDAHPMECLMRATFYVEGGILRPRLAFDGGLDLYWSVLDAKFASTGLPGLNDGGFELLSLTRDSLPQLNDIRRRMVEGRRA